MSKILKLSDVCLNIIDCPHESPVWLTEGYARVIRNFNLIDGQISDAEPYYVDENTYNKRTRRAIPEPGDIIFSREAPIGNCAIVPEGFKCCLGQRLVLLKVDHSKVSSEYLLAVLMSTYVKYQIEQVSKRGSTVSNFNIGDLSNLEIPVLTNQSDIAKFANNISTKIANNYFINNKLESFVKTIYDYWFLQFEFPNEDGNPYKSSGGKMVWNEELKREIPEGWEYKPIVSLLSQDKGGDWGKELLTGNYQEHVNCIRGADFPAALGHKVMNAPERWILTKNKHKELSYGDILVEISGGSPTQSTGRVCYINNNFLKRFDNSVIASNFCKALSLKCPKYYSWFYLMWQKLYDNGLFFNYEGKTTGLKNLLFEVATTEVKILIPNDAVLDSFTALVDSMFEKIQFNCKESQELASLRDFLLPMLMNGQVTFRD